MRNVLGSKITVPVLVMGMTVAVPIYAQDNGSASQSMHRAGESARDAASDAGQMVEHAYHGVATAVSDTAITAKVKGALHENKLTKDADIHVHTVAGVVTLHGTVPSTDAVAAAQQVAQQTSGVKEVKNELTMSPVEAR
jgi:osmotically-inducible protein OsmY